MNILNKISVAKSDYFMNRARDSCFSPPLNTTDSKTNPVPGNYFSPVFLDSYIMGVTALEAFVNERIVINMQIISNRIATKLADSVEVNNKKILEMLIEQDLVSKYRLMPILLWQKSFDESKSPFQDFVYLVSIRNDIIHYKMPFYNDQNQKPKWVRKLEEKHILLPQPLQYCRIWIDEICTLEGARWAYNTCCKMMKQYVNLADGIIKATCQDYVESFKEL